MADLMIDIEALGSDPESIILTIGAQIFDPSVFGWYEKPQYDAVSQTNYLPYMYVKVDVDTQESEFNRTLSEDTMNWWSRQSQDAFDEAFDPDNRVSLPAALTELSKLVMHCKHIWTKGPTYDITILEHAYRSAKIKVPWKFWAIRDARTLYSLCPQLNDKLNGHIALDDCRNQIVLLQESLRVLNIEVFK